MGALTCWLLTASALLALAHAAILPWDYLPQLASTSRRAGQACVEVRGGRVI